MNKLNILNIIKEKINQVIDTDNWEEKSINENNIDREYPIINTTEELISYIEKKYKRKTKEYLKGAEIKWINAKLNNNYETINNTALKLATNTTTEKICRKSLIKCIRENEYLINIENKKYSKMNKESRTEKMTEKEWIRKYKAHCDNARQRGYDNYLTFKVYKEVCSQKCYMCDMIAYGVDRINSNIGYEKDNIAPCCYVCNKIKSSFDDNIIYEKIKLIYNNINKI